MLSNIRDSSICTSQLPLRLLCQPFEISVHISKGVDLLGARDKRDALNLRPAAKGRDGAGLVGNASGPIASELDRNDSENAFWPDRLFHRFLTLTVMTDA